MSSLSAAKQMMLAKGWGPIPVWPLNAGYDLNISNMLQCNKCKDIISSIGRNDFKWCSCRHVAVDGGNDYLKRCGRDYTELSF